MERNERLRIGFLLHDVSRLRRTAFDQRMRPLRITRSQWWVLTGVSRHNGGDITQTELADVLDLGKVALGGLIDRLERSGFVDRLADPNDRRANKVHLTRKGESLLLKMGKLGDSMNAEVMNGITLEEQHQLADLLHRMKNNLLAMDAVPGRANRRRAAAAAPKSLPVSGARELSTTSAGREPSRR